MRLQTGKERLFRAVKDVLRSAGTDTPAQERASWIHWPILILSMGAAARIAVRLGQDTSFDVLNYHFYSGFAFLNKPLSYDFAPAQVQSFFNPLMHVFSYLLLSNFHAKMAAAVLGAIQGVNFYLVFRISQSLFRRWRAPYRQILSLGNAAAGFYGTVGIMELGTTFGDNLASVATLSGLLMLIRWLSDDLERARPSLLWLGSAGAVIGVAFGLKLTVAICVAGAAVALPVALLPHRLRMRPLVIFYGGLAAGFLATYGFWGAHLYGEFRNPVFPYLNNVFRSPYFVPENTMDPRFMPRTWEQTLFYPFFFAGRNQWVSEIQFRDIRLALCYVGVVLLAAIGLVRLIRRARGTVGPDAGAEGNPLLVFFAVFFTVSYLAWQQLFCIYRYLAVLELLAPAFLALVLARLTRSRPLVLAMSLLVNFAVCRSVIPADFGRQRFDDGFLKVQAPRIPDLDQSVILMVNDEPTSFVVPSFPASTRFVRISCNFLRPGQNPGLDEYIAAKLAPYADSRTYVYVANAGEKGVARVDLAAYGKEVDDRSCWDVGSGTGNKGYLCRTRTVIPPETRPVPAPPPPAQPSAPVSSLTPLPALPAPSAPAFVRQPQVRLEVAPAEIQAGRDTVQYHVIGLKAKAVDLLYSINGERMPPIRNWALPAGNIIRIFANSGTRRGRYHFIGIRDSAAPHPDLWIELDANATVK